MSQTLFTLPAGLDITVGELLSITYDGSVQLGQTLGRPIGVIVAGGDVDLNLDVVTGQIRGGGKVLISGKVDADIIHGNEVHLGNGDVKCRVISADSRIVIGAAKLSVDVIMAPEVVIDARASGRVTIVQSNVEVGPTKIKGGFSLAEYADAVGDPATYLEDRGLTDLATRMRGGALPSPAAPVPPPAPAAATPPRVTSPRPEPLTAPQPSIPRPIEKVATAQPEEDVGDPMSLSMEDLEPLKEAGVDPLDELHPKLLEAVKRIAACYEGKEVPPAVVQLRDLVEGRDYDHLRENITEVWNGLLGYHQKKGIRPHHQVTHAFNVIHGLVQQG